MQMREFWRPSAWADYVHAYTFWDRLMVGRMKHVFFNPLEFFYRDFPTLGLACYFGLGTWKGLLFLAMIAFSFSGFCAVRLQAAKTRNLLPNPGNASESEDMSGHQGPMNMQTLLRHIRLLEAAGCMIRSHVSNHHSAPDQDNAVKARNVNSSLALMHASRHQALVLNNLEARLWRAFDQCRSYDPVLARRYDDSEEQNVESRWSNPDTKARALSIMEARMLIHLQAYSNRPLVAILWP